MLTPLAVGLGRPFPYISNLSLSLAVLVRDPQTDHVVFARVKVPKEMLPRFVPVVEGETEFVLLEELIAANLAGLFPGMEIVDHGLFRVTRDADFEVADEADDLLEAVEAELRRRPFGEVVRLEVEERLSAAPARGADRGDARRGAAGLQRARAARHERPLAARRAARPLPSCAPRRGRRSRSRGSPRPTARATTSSA